MGAVPQFGLMGSGGNWLVLLAISYVQTQLIDNCSHGGEGLGESNFGFDSQSRLNQDFRSMTRDVREPDSHLFLISSRRTQLLAVILYIIL